MSVKVALPSGKRSDGGAQRNETYWALKRELDEFISRGPTVSARIFHQRFPLARLGRTRARRASSRDSSLAIARRYHIFSRSSRDHLATLGSRATPLHHAAEEGDDVVIEALLAIGADVDEVDSEGQTALMLAASWGHPSSVNALIRVGNASINLKDEGGDTALHEAARANELETLSELISLGADKDARNKLGATPLLLASHAGHKRIVVALLDAGAAATGKKSLMRGGYSPLHAAAANGSTECLQDLIDAGASLRHSASDSALGRGTAGGGNNGSRGSATALELAEDLGQSGSASLLKRASVSEFERYGMWGNPADAAAAGAGEDDGGEYDGGVD